MRSDRESLPVHPGALAVVRGDEPQVFLASDAGVLSRLLGLELVAKTPASAFVDIEQLDAVRRALLGERWAEAVLTWMEATGNTVDVYDGWPRVWTDADLDDERASLEIRISPLFVDSGA